MNFVKQFQAGMTIGLKSFGLLWKHKKLIVYIGVPIIIGITLELIVYNLFFFTPTNSAIFMRGIMVNIWSTFGWTKHLGLLITQMIKFFVIIFAVAALTHHTSQLLHRRVTSIKKSINACLPKLKQIIVWAALSTFFFLIINQIDSIVTTSKELTLSLIATCIGITLRAMWSLSTLFVIPIIVLSTKPLIPSIKKSVSITKNLFSYYCGALTWLGIIGILSYTPFLLFKTQSVLAQTSVYALLALVRCILSTTHTIIKTKLYFKA